MGVLDGRLAVLFGASGGLGRPLAQALVAAGATVVGADRAAPTEPLPGVTPHPVDVHDEGQLAALFAELAQPPWAVLNTVGGFAPASPIAELDIATLDEQHRLNLRSAALITKHALRAMAPVGAGRIVHTASRAAVAPAGSGLAYSASKQGVIRLVELAAADVRGTWITVNCVLPSIIDTPANRAAMPGADFDRWPRPEELAEVYLFLASPASGLISGAAVPAYGRA